ncbi:hypothetical protein PZN02_000170 [Sinorhizobium garamanticum]|uniref:Uncharacterized protein n=1 Tax=Sinorhizobium garamanticum TaxID=680247 RepID=A0ABY8DBS3_9HYPH|nr:hypothetical protein [Sinorhizobium garamanticum]WEX87742.1 hypothetical protein PZN02_000170 [Sinorhizobium garamanticum]
MAVKVFPLVRPQMRHRSGIKKDSPMLKIFSILKRTGLASDSSTDAPVDWLRDPLQHPDLARMDERALADLPFPGWPSPRAAASGPCDHR